MSRTSITVNGITRAGTPGVTPTACDVSNGNQVVNNGQTTWLEVTNSAGASGTLTVQPTRTVDGQMVAAITHTIPATTTVPIKYGPFSAMDYSSNLEFNGSAATILVAAYSM
jgi:hypothetical protein